MRNECSKYLASLGIVRWRCADRSRPRRSHRTFAGAGHCLLFVAAKHSPPIAKRSANHVVEPLIHYSHDRNLLLDIGFMAGATDQIARASTHALRWSARTPTRRGLRCVIFSSPACPRRFSVLG